MQFLLASALLGWLGIVFAKDVVAASPPDSFWSEVLTESLGLAALSIDSWISEDHEEDSEALLRHSVLTETRSGPADPTPPGFLTSLSPESEGPLLTGATQDNTTRIPLSPQKRNAGRRGLLRALGTAALFIVLCFALLSLLSRGVLGGKKTKRRRYDMQEDPGLTGADGSFIQQLNELDDLQPHAARMAEIVGSRESLSVLQNFRNSVERAKQVQQEVSGGLISSWDSSESLMQKALDSVISDLSRLFELTRQHGLGLAQETREVPAPPILLEQEVNALAHMDTAFTASLALHLENLDFSCRAFKHYAAKVEENLQALPKFKGLKDRLLLGAVAAGVEFIKAAHGAVKMGTSSIVGLASSASAFMLSQVVSEQLRIHRECRDLLQQRRALWSAEVERLHSPTEEEIGVLDELKALEDMLNKGERLLQIHQAEIEQLQKRDKLSAQPAVQQAKEVGEELKALLEAAALRMHSITGIASAEESAQGVWGQKTIDAMASRARQEVKATSKRVANILARVQLGQLFLPQPDTTQIHKQEGIETKTIVNPTVLKLVTESLQQLRDNITAVAVSLNLSSEASETTTGLAAAAQRATVAAKELAEKAEMLLLRAQFLESLELDLQLSSRLAQRAAALAGAGAEDIQQANQVSVELPAPQKKQVGLLLHQVNTTKAKAMSQWTLVDIVKTAATMKGAALGLALTVWAHQLDSTLRTKQ